MALRRLLILATIVTAVTLVFWLGTGRHYYTKFQVIERVEVAIDPDDPLVAAGFYDEDDALTELRTETRDGFHLGLLPTPIGLIDKHVLAVTSIAAPFWLAVAGSFVLRRFSRASGMSAALTLDRNGSST